MSINEADLPTRRHYNASVAFPQSHVTTGPTETTTFITGPKGDKGDPGASGEPGPQGQWDAMTMAEYDALPSKDPATLYVIIP